MAGLTGLEPATSYVTGRHSNQLSYSPAHPQSETFYGASRHSYRPSATYCPLRAPPGPYLGETGLEPVTPSL